MDLSGVPTPTMDWENSNLTTSWAKFQQHCELIFNGPMSRRSDAVKANYILLWVGDKGRDIFNTWTLTEDDKKDPTVIFTKFKHHVQPKLNPVFAQFKFNNEIQGSKTIDQYVTSLKLLAKDCLFKDEDDMIRDRIVFGVSSQRIREKLINEGEKLTLERAINISQSHEYAQE
ncbi:hypothetical protein ACJMK2_044224 [Sinanodonta woodiana]|uniref:Retrotransposon gag domain-containing protein n=1 Tax=Sinanodonta woodiana TaxID=1069815 RepID=A0ABD3W0P5_SINWO